MTSAARRSRPPAWVALSGQARRRAHVLRRAAGRAPPGAAYRTAALPVERAGRARRRHQTRRDASHPHACACRPLPARRRHRRARMARGAARARGHPRGSRRGAVHRTGGALAGARRASTPSRTPGRCGSTSTSPDSFITCGRSSPSGPATCLSRAAAGAHTPTGYSTSRSQPPMRTSPRACRPTRSSAPTRGSSTASASTSTAGRTSPTSPAKTEAGSCASSGSVNGKTGRHARILEADFQLAPYTIEQLVGDLPDPTPPATTRRHGRRVEHQDPVQADQPARVLRAARRDRGTARRAGPLPRPWHPDQHPSCSVGTDSTTGWKCHGGSCGAGGAIYDLASVLLGGPWGRELRGEQFKHARAYVADVFGELT